VFAYVLMTYRDPGQIMRLVARLRALSPDAFILVRHDARATELVERDSLEAAGAIVHEYRDRIDWGGWSMVAAQVRELRWVLENHPRVTHIVFLSGQDYPLRPLADWEERVGDGEFDLVGPVREERDLRMRWLAPNQPYSRGHRSTYAYRRIPARWSGGPVGVLPRITPFLRPVIDARRLPHTSDMFIGVRHRLHGLRLYTSVPWLTLSRAAAGAVVAAHEDSPEKRLLRRALLPEETFVPTVVMNRGMRLAVEDVSYCRFDGWVWHPEVFTSADIPALRATGAPFARKFDLAIDPLVLDALDGCSQPPSETPGGGEDRREAPMTQHDDRRDAGVQQLSERPGRRDP
jgi:hypothetical protein